MYCTNEAKKDILDPAKQISKILMSCPKLGVAVALDQSGIRPTPESVEEVLKRFSNAGMLIYQFFDWASKQRHYEHSIRAYHAMVESLAKIRQYEIMWDLINSMRTKGLLNIETFCIIMNGCLTQKFEEAIYTFNVMEKYNVPPNLAAFNGLLSALCKSKNVRKAQEIFNTMKDRFVPDQKTYSLLIEGWGRDPNLPMAREIYREMISDGCRPDIVTYGIMVDILCKAGRVDEAIDIIKDMEYNDCQPTSFIYSILVHTYGIENRIEDAVDTFLEMEKNCVKADVAVYNALISAFCKVNKLKNAYRVLNEMESKGVKPNSRTCNILLNHLIEHKETDEAFKWKGDIVWLLSWKFMKKKQFVPSLHTFSVLINGLCENQDASQACMLMEEMIEKGIRPPRLTFGRLRKLLIEQRRDDVLEFLQQKSEPIGPVKGLSIYGTMICIGFKDDVLTNPTGSSTSFMLHLQITCQSFREAIGIELSFVPIFLGGLNKP
ncbi:pentatricopeptide repeat-containing protein [Tanacetum coccineum]